MTSASDRHEDSRPLGNPADRRFFTPKAYGVGWDINFFWLVHPVRYMRGRRAR